MSRRRRKSGEVVSLFPFLSILSCLIGSLTLMISAMAMIQTNPEEAQDPEKAKRADEYAFLVKDKEKKEKLLKVKQNTNLAFKEKLNSVNQLQKEIITLQNNYTKLKENKQDLNNVYVTRQTKETVDREVKSKISVIQKESVLIDKDLLILKKKELELNQKLKLIKNNIDKGVKYKVTPSGSGVNIDPYFIECNAQGIVVFTESDPLHIPAQVMSIDKRLINLMAEVRGKPKASIIFLIRPKGFLTYSLASRLARASYTRNGKLPILGEGHIDLSSMKED